MPSPENAPTTPETTPADRIATLGQQIVIARLETALALSRILKRDAQIVEVDADAHLEPSKVLAVCQAIVALVGE